MLCDDIAEQAVGLYLESIVKKKRGKIRYNTYLSKLDQYGKGKRNIDLKTECLVCGDQEKRHLQFHHLNPKIKEYNIGEKKEPGIQELKKCVVVCSNCHIDFHYFTKVKHIEIVNQMFLDE